MRIRKNGAFIFSDVPDQNMVTHRCQVNKSPWDVISFSDDSFPSFHKFDGKHGIHRNESLGDSVGAVESFTSLIEEEQGSEVTRIEADNPAVEEDAEVEESSNSIAHLHCKNNDDCKHDPALPFSFGRKKSRMSMSNPRCGRAKKNCHKKGSSSTSKQQEFYYYSGFGPWWGKKRGEEMEQLREKDDDENGNVSVEVDHGAGQNMSYYCGIDYIDEEDDEDEEEWREGVKRIRKPVKARSLKSLM